MKKKAASPKNKMITSPNVLNYLAAVEEWKNDSTSSATATTASTTRNNDNDKDNDNRIGGGGTTRNLTNNTSACIVTENIHSLLKDVIHTQTESFFTSFAAAAAAAVSVSVSNITDSTFTTASSSTAPLLPPQIPLPPSRHVLNDIAKDKICFELNTMYEEYSFDRAKDASITDDYRREQKAERQRLQQKQQQTRNVANLGDPDHQRQQLQQLQQQLQSEDSLVYGEIDMEGFFHLLQSLLPPRIIASNGTGTFYDLGSGSGRAVFCARFSCDFQQCIGIELLPNLHDLAVSVSSLYKFLYSHKLHYSTVSFQCANLMTFDWWTNGTVVYAPSLLFDDVLMDCIATKAIFMASGTYLIGLKKFQEPQQSQSQSQSQSLQVKEEKEEEKQIDNDDNDNALKQPSPPPLATTTTTTTTSSSSPPNAEVVGGGEDHSSREVVLKAFQDAFELVEQSVFPMSWGDATVYVYRRR
jgi:hypothetical protein